MAINTLHMLLQKWILAQCKVEEAEEEEEEEEEKDLYFHRRSS